MTKLFLRAAFLALTLAGLPAQAGTALEHLKSDLLGKRSATQVLTAWCATLKLASPAVIRAEKISGVGALPGPRVRALLHVGTKDVVRHRRVRLMCGSHLMSEADNWYLPARLTPAMNHALDTTDTSFGTVVRPLDFHRRTLEAKSGPRAGLEIVAILVTATGAPFSLVVEDYADELVAGPPR
jgi:hypothetical protein